MITTVLIMMWKSFVLVASFLAVSYGLSSDTVDSAKTDIKSLFASESRYNARAVRLIFHDCVSDACDGCVNFDLESGSNEGLADVLEDLETIYADYSSEMSRADFWTLAAISAIERATFLANGQTCTYGVCDVINVPDIEFKSGRVDCSTSPYGTEEPEFPDATMTRTEMFDYMADHFGYDETQTIALMGAHTLGKSHKSASGYNGNFVEGDQFKFTNQYYKDMVNSSITWSAETISRTGKHQWDGTDSDGTDYGTRLHTDLEMLYDIELNDDDTASCDPVTSCTVADSYSTVESYANDADTWASDFVDVFQLLITRGYDSLDDLE